MPHPRAVACAVALLVGLATPVAARAADPALTVAPGAVGSVSGPGIACPGTCAATYPLRTVRVCEPDPELLPGQCEWVDELRPRRSR
jgi:hypothetical protein